MLQGFPAETGVPRLQKEPPKLEGFYSEKARALDKLLALDKELAAKQATAAEKALAARSAHVSTTARPRTFAAPVLTVLAAIVLAVVAIASWRAAPPTTSIGLATDVVLPAHAVVSEPRVPAEISVPVPAVVDVPLRDKPAPVSAIANLNQLQPARVSSLGDLNVSEAQPVATSLQALLGAPVDEPTPPQLSQPPHVGAPGTAPSIVLRPIDPPIDPPAERLEAAPIAVAPRPADPTPAIRDVLRRYEAAYERLDASAAKEIWPTVDERALARAFAGLASQTLRLEPCNIDVTGSSAVASCHGFATYVGRVGNKMGQVQRRDWTFELRKSTDDWQIRSVRSN